ncbi:uncharacterized protein PAC_19486 [Phialocephala subalpina]|uniref:Uncharacterized protein n=1 Tax=Phialocephala subalpina TaxID=576137 RepID=A0A1L7XX29_9HELO|nr:uncharacterized protein PAC_19486 [Phialocephala subalpina]
MAAIQQDKEATAKSRAHGELDQAPAGYESTESRSKRMLLGCYGGTRTYQDAINLDEFIFTDSVSTSTGPLQ